MRRSRFLHLRALGAAALTGALALTVAPPPGSTAPAAAPSQKIVERANATALKVYSGGQANGSGVFRSYSTATRTTTEGTRSPRIEALDGQNLVTVGTLAQNAKNDIRYGRRGARACAGLAGTGATLVSIDKSTCLEPRGAQAVIDSGRVDLSDLRIIRSEAFQGLDDELQAAGQPAIDALAPVLDEALSTVLQGIGDPRIKLDFAAITGTCFANRQEAIGRARLDNSRLYVQAGDQKVVLARLPLWPKPNTKVVTQLDGLAQLIADGVKAQLTEGLTGVLAPGAPGVQQLVDALNANVLTSLSEQLQPVEDNLVKLTLNQQVRPRKNAIRTTSLILRVLPAASGDSTGDPLAAHIGSAACVAPLR